MNKCFITKFPSSVDNDNLPVLGQLSIKWLKQSDLADNDARAIALSTNDSITVKVSGAHLTDNTLSSNLGNSKTITKDNGLVWLYVSNDADAILTIDNKYSLTKITFVRPNKDGHELKRSVKFDINDIRYCTALDFLNLHNTNVSGDISVVTNLTALTYLSLYNTQVSGDISAVSNLTALTDLNLNYTKVSGDISAVSNLTALTGLHLEGTQVSGKVDSLSRLIKLTELLNLKGLSLTGDMSKIPANIRFISQKYRKLTTAFTWTAKARQNAELLAMEEVPFDTVSMDNMLIDQATCTVSPFDNSLWWYKFISVSGVRTSASDAAVEAIQNMGVTITGVTKES